MSKRKRKRKRKESIATGVPEEVEDTFRSARPIGHGLTCVAGQLRGSSRDQSVDHPIARTRRRLGAECAMGEPIGNDANVLVRTGCRERDDQIFSCVRHLPKG